MSLQSLMQHIRRDPPDAAEWERIGCIGLLLSSPDKATVAEQLTRLKSLGGSLRQVGSLALFSDVPRVGQVLSGEFGIHPHDYRSTGGESGVDARAGYPLLAHLAFMGETDLMRRALEWGADPNASWKVKRVMGTYQDGAEVVSWVGECIRRAEHDFLEVLLPRCAPPSIEEQDRRLVALGRCIVHKGKGKSQDAADTINLFAPGGPYPMDRSFWDVCEVSEKEEKRNLGLSLLLGSTHFNSAIAEQRHWPDVVRWLKDTAPADGIQQTQAGLALASSAANFPRSLPDWCLDHMANRQVQEVLERGLANAIERSFSDWKSSRSKQVGRDMSRYLDVHENLIHRLQQAGEDFPDAFRRVVSHLPLSQFQALPMDMWDGLQDQWPKHLAPLAHDPFFVEMVEVIGVREAANDAPARSIANLRLVGLHENALMCRAAQQAAGVARAPRL